MVPFPEQALAWQDGRVPAARQARDASLALRKPRVTSAVTFAEELRQSAMVGEPGAIAVAARDLQRVGELDGAVGAAEDMSMDRDVEAGGRSTDPRPVREDPLED